MLAQLQLPQGQAMAAACACVTGTLNDLSTLQALRMRSLIVCQARRDGPAPLQRGAAQWVGPFMWTGAGLAGAALLAPGPADAYETKAWMPRRHYRGMKEARTPPHFEVQHPQQHLALHCLRLCAPSPTNSHKVCRRVKYGARGKRRGPCMMSGAPCRRCLVLCKMFLGAARVYAASSLRMPA